MRGAVWLPFFFHGEKRYTIGQVAPQPLFTHLRSPSELRTFC
jgi:hypothetical protein